MSNINISANGSTKYINTDNDKNEKKLPELYNNMENCCGCTSCYSVCPVSAISMTADDEGFLYPTVDASKCVRCYKCMTVCSFKEDQFEKGFLDKAENQKSSSKRELLAETAVYAAKLKNSGDILKSSSGGAFTALSDVFLANGNAVVCSTYDNSLHQQKYVIIENENARNAARGAKYMQSIPGDIFKKAELWLKANKDKQILFVGVGCQAAGFVKYSETKGFRDKVTVVDMICHGSPSPLIWTEYVKSLEKKYGKVESANFKDKRNGWKAPVRYVVINGKEISIREYAKIFYAHLDLRVSCHKCPYATTERYTDITLGDYWGIEDKIPDFYDDKGVSLILIHTSKGEKLFEKASASLDYVKSSVKDCLQPMLIAPTAFEPKREQFWQDYHKNGIEYVVHKYGNDSITTKIKRKIKRLISK